MRPPTSRPSFARANSLPGWAASTRPAPHCAPASTPPAPRATPTPPEKWANFSPASAARESSHARQRVGDAKLGSKPTVWRPWLQRELQSKEQVDTAGPAADLVGGHVILDHHHAVGVEIGVPVADELHDAAARDAVVNWVADSAGIELAVVQHGQPRFAVVADVGIVAQTLQRSARRKEQVAIVDASPPGNVERVERPP